MSTTIVETNKQVESKPEVKAPEAPVFGGRYSDLMGKMFRESQVIFGLDKVKAEKFARQVASDFGAYQAAAKVTANIGKSITKDNKITLTEMSKAKGVTATNAITAASALMWCAEAGKHGFLWGKTKWQVSEVLELYFSKL